MQAALYKFGYFELDPARFELRRNGNPIKIEHIPMELLILLVEKDGAVVSRQEIGERLWGKDVFVDTEHGINTAIRKIRAALKEDVEKPRFVQTVPGKGYRFMAEVTNCGRVTSVPAEALPDKIVTEPILPALSTPERRAWWKLAVAAAATVAMAVGLTLWYQPRALKNVGKIQSIAVLPFANLSGDASQDYFADGITDELITTLVRNTSLHVVSRTSVMQYKNVSRPMKEVARELGADSILEGSVNRTGNHVHLNLQLIDARRDTHIWANTYDRDVSEFYTLPSELAYTIASLVKTPATPVKPQRYISPQAHDAYMRGRFFWFAEDYSRSRDFMQKAIELQPDYAPAWSGLADDYAVLAVADQVPARQVMETAMTAARKAMALDDSLPEAHTTMGALHLFYDWDWKGADEESRKALALNPDFAEAHHLRAYLQTVLNRHKEALDEQKRSSELDPFARPFALGFVLTLLHQFDDAISELLARKKDLPQDVTVRMCLSEAYRLKGMPKDAAREFEEAMALQGDKRLAKEYQRVFDRGGDRAIAKWRIERRSNPEVSKLYLSPLTMAHWQARAGNKDGTLKALEDAYKERTPFLVFVQREPDFDFLHSEPRYRDLVQKIGLPPAD